MRANWACTSRVSASTPGVSSTTSGTSVKRATRWFPRAGSSSRTRPVPARGSAACRRHLDQPARSRWCRSRAGRRSPVSGRRDRGPTSASSRSPATTSSITPSAWPIASGVTASGKTTVSLSGRSGRTRGRCRPVARSRSRLGSATTTIVTRSRGAGPLGQWEHDRQQAGHVDRRGGVGVHRLAERDAALEGAVLDLHLLVVADGAGRPPPLAGDDELRSATSMRSDSASTLASSTTTVSAGGSSVGSSPPAAESPPACRGSPGAARGRGRAPRSRPGAGRRRASAACA